MRADNRATPDGLRVDANVHIDTGDVALAADVYRPADADRVTVVVTRTMYGKNRHQKEGRGWAARGLGYVVQDVRGRYESDGTFSPYRNERADGAVLLGWVQDRPWAGDVVLLGGSYNAYAAWAAAVTRPDIPRGVVSLAPAMGFDTVKFDPAGVLRLAEHINWWVDHADGRVDREGLADTMTAVDPTIVSHLPVRAIGARLWTEAPGWEEVVARGPRPGPEAVGDTELKALDVHSLHVCGWYDLVAADTIRLWRAVAAGTGRGRSHRLVMGPWDHDLTLGGTSGAAPVYPAEPFDLGGTIVNWLAGFDDATPGPEARLLPIGSREWLQTSTWPPSPEDMAAPLGGDDSADADGGPGEDGPPAEWWFATANGVLTDGRLAEDPGADTSTGRVGFVDDPAGPVPSVAARADRRHLDVRVDIARFTSAPLTTRLTIAGTPTVTLWADATCSRSDWIVRLVVLLPDGRVAELATGTHVAVTDAVAGASVELSPCHAAVDPGQRLRLEVAGTDFPRLARHLGRGGDRYRGQEMRRSARAVLTGPDTPTAILLPLCAEGGAR